MSTQANAPSPETTKHLATLAARAGLEPSVVPYVFEDCAGESWRLRRGVSARELLGEPAYSVTGYFGNEAGDAAFYAVAAIVVDVPSAAARRRIAAEC